MTSVDLDALRASLIRACAAYADGKRRFAEVTRAYTSIPGIDPTNAEHRASSDYRRRKAVEDCQFARAEMQAYGMALLALTLTQPVRTWDDHVADAIRLTTMEAVP